MSSSPPSGHLAPRLAVIALVALGVTVFAVYRLSQSQSAPQETALLDMGGVPDFSFTTQGNKAFSRRDLLGEVTITNFIFTRCPTICPVFTMKMQRISERLPEQIKLLSFSVDPEYDTPERLRAYAEKYDADPARWRFVTGDAKAVRETVEGALKISMEDQGKDFEGLPDIVHGTHFVLLDQNGRIRGYYNSDEVERLEDLMRDARRLYNNPPIKE